MVLWCDSVERHQDRDLSSVAQELCKRKNQNSAARVTFIWFFMYSLLTPESQAPVLAASDAPKAVSTCGLSVPWALCTVSVAPAVQHSLKSLLLCVSGQNEGTISVAEGEMLYVIEEDKGDGWTRIRRNEDEEGYVPTSYVEVYLDKNAKGAMTYI